MTSDGFSVYRPFKRIYILLVHASAHFLPTSQADYDVSNKILPYFSQVIMNQNNCMSTVMSHPSAIFLRFIIVWLQCCMLASPVKVLALASPQVIRVFGQPAYGIACNDLSHEWVRLIQEDRVVATINAKINNNDVQVKYGVRLVTRPTSTRCEEFVQQVNEQIDDCTVHAEVENIQKALAEMQDKSLSSGLPAVRFVKNGPFIAQLQLIRTLRPPPSPGFSGVTSSIPPPYDPSTDSFLTGPLRLELRPRVALLNLSQLNTPWDVFHNVSPADTRGHFLLLPTITDPRNWRGQIFCNEDCFDVIHLTSSIQPVGSLFVGFNSVGAGASQNHIHCHAWPSPPLPLFDQTTEGWDSYAVSKATTIFDYCDVGSVEISYLEYPVFCVLLSSDDLKSLSQVLMEVLRILKDSPYNIGFFNRRKEEEEEQTSCMVDVYVFARSKERSGVIPGLKLGVSEMMGVFHAQSESELELLAPLNYEGNNTASDSPMEQALQEVSYENELSLWETIKERLQQLPVKE